MIDCGSLEYACARLQSRHGQRPDETAWRRIEVLRDFSPLLDGARATALRPWLVGITADSGAHQIEATLRGHWRTLIAEVAGWMPRPWQSAVSWCAVLPDLAPLQHLARGAAPPPWMQADGDWRAMAQATPSQRAAILAAGPLAPLAGAWPAPDAFGQTWQLEWRRRLPRAPGAAELALAQLVRALAGHRQAFAQAAAGQGWMLRGALRDRLSLLLRRVALEPAAAFIHIALWALELERLRSELLSRVLFPRSKVA